MGIKKRFGKAVKKRRVALGFSQEKLALRIDVDQAYISRVEAGNMNVTLESIEELALALKISPHMLLKPTDT